MSRRVWRRVAAGAVATGVLAGVLVVTATPAAAHVTVSPPEATQGGFARVDFRAPTESDTESTTKLEVFFPEEDPIPSVSVVPVPGWEIEVSRRTLDEPVEGGHGEQITEVVESITWTNEDEQAAIEPGELGEFGVLMGPMPEVDELFFRALQTYSDDTVVRWIELPADEGDEPPLPAPSLRLVAGHDAHGDPAVDDGGPASGEEGGESTATGESTADGAGVWFGLAGLLAGLAGLALGGVAFIRTRASGAGG